MNGFTILIGDAYGNNFRVQKYFFENSYENVVIYYVCDIIRNNYGNYIH
jgi:hypothetical protein